MANFKDTVKESFFSYPTLYGEKWNVLEHYFACIGNGMEWNSQGELTDKFDSKKKFRKMMKYSDLNKKDLFQKRGLELISDDHKKKILIQNEIERFNRKIISKNIDFILEQPCSQVLFSSYVSLSKDMPHYMTSKGVCVEYAKAFNYPENISKDWAEGLLDFICFWINWISCLEKDNVSIETTKLLLKLKEVKFDLVEKTTGKNRETQEQDEKEFAKEMVEFIKELNENE